MRLGYLIIEVSLTALDWVVTVHVGRSLWVAWSGNLLSLGLLVVMAAVGATSLANVWVRAIARIR